MRRGLPPLFDQQLYFRQRRPAIRGTTAVDHTRSPPLVRAYYTRPSYTCQVRVGVAWRQTGAPSAAHGFKAFFARGNLRDPKSVVSVHDHELSPGDHSLAHQKFDGVLQLLVQFDHPAPPEVEDVAHQQLSPSQTKVNLQLDVPKKPEIGGVGRVLTKRVCRPALVAWQDFAFLRVGLDGARQFRAEEKMDADG